jgi:hypothetical protein
MLSPSPQCHRLRIPISVPVYWYVKIALHDSRFLSLSLQIQFSPSQGIIAQRKRQELGTVLEFPFDTNLV